MTHILITICAVLLLFGSCKQAPDVKDDNPIIATVYHYELKMSELKEVISEDVSPPDSTAMANAYIESWLREKIWIEEAEQKMGTDEDIESLVDAYRSSLIKLQYENKIIEEKLDSMISDQEYLDTYEMYKTQFTLDDQLLRCWMVRLPTTTEGLSQFYKDFKGSDATSVEQYSQLYDGISHLNDTIWIARKELEKMVPQSLIKKADMIRKVSFRKKKDGYYYFLKYIDFRDKNDFPPLEYIKGELKRLILHRRKQKIIADLTEQMYEAKLKNNQIQVFTNPS